MIRDGAQEVMLAQESTYKSTLPLEEKFDCTETIINQVFAHCLPKPYQWVATEES